jgi:hypothetical protein
VCVLPPGGGRFRFFSAPKIKKISVSLYLPFKTLNTDKKRSSLSSQGRRRRLFPQVNVAPHHQTTTTTKEDGAKRIEKMAKS